MTVIRSSCPECGEVEMEASDMALSWDLRSYLFRCPSCGEGVRKKTDRKIVSLLRAAGVVRLNVDPRDCVPAESGALRDRPLSLDDVIDFHFTMDSELEGLLSA